MVSSAGQAGSDAAGAAGVPAASTSGAELGGGGYSTANLSDQTQHLLGSVTSCGACSQDLSICLEDTATCVQCTENSHCGDPTPHCDTTKNTCSECLDSVHCVSPAPHCDPNNNACVGCLDASHCSELMPVCDPDHQVCVGCLDASHCSEPAPVCDLNHQVCVGCLDASHCSKPTPVCDTDHQVCVGCLDSSHCSEPTAVCDPNHQVCVGCLTASDCLAPTPVCDTDHQVCVECLTSADCGAPEAARCEAGACLPCTAQEDCQHFAATRVCELTSGTCVECTGALYDNCQDESGNALVCDSVSKICSTERPGSVGLCEPCLSDAHCRAGQLCVAQEYGDPPQHIGNFCFWRQGSPDNDVAPADCYVSGAPYVRPAELTSIDGEAAEVCTLRTSTCVAHQAFSDVDCASEEGTADDSLCGADPPNDGFCLQVSETSFRCTVSCSGNDDCLPQVECNTTVSNPYCTL